MGLGSCSTDVQFVSGFFAVDVGVFSEIRLYIQNLFYLVLYTVESALNTMYLLSSRFCSSHFQMYNTLDLHLDETCLIENCR